MKIEKKKEKKLNLIKLFLASFLILSAPIRAQDFLDVKLPPGFQLELFMDSVPGARSIVQSRDGVFYVGTREKQVYRLSDTSGDARPDKLQILIKDLNMPNGVAIKDGDLYIAEVNRILRIRDVEKNYRSPKPEIFFDQLPSETWHGWKFIAFGPDENLYIPIGAPCNVCNPKLPYASIHRLNLKTKKLEMIAQGVRNSVGFDWDPQTKELWFSDNGRDMMGDEMPPCELNHLKKVGENFGFPFCHGGVFQDTEFKLKSCTEFKAPAQNLGPHVAPLGIHFYRGKMFPKEYQNQIFIAEHGSWNRKDPLGYRVSLVRLDKSRKPVSYESFLDGWLRGRSPVARPVAFWELIDGSLLISDDHGGRIFRLSYKK